MKNYVAPVSAVLSMNMNENIASSGTGKSILVNNNRYYTVDGMIEGLEGLEVAGMENTSNLVNEWIFAIAAAGLKDLFDQLMKVCKVSGAGQ